MPLLLLLCQSLELSFLPWLPGSTPPTHLDEYFFFKSLVVGLSYSSIFWQFWLYFVLRLVVNLFMVVQGGKACPPAPLFWLEVVEPVLNPAWQGYIWVVTLLCCLLIIFFFFFLRFYSFTFRERGRKGRKKGRETSVCKKYMDPLPLAHPTWGPGPQLSHVSWLGIKLSTSWFAGQHSIH